ncbi:WecB/TagA/CpsF family glycosyltransferase [Terribacillus halophilus]|uniref:WecB/TagA/CpsF family glycosyltransferase n=1 Tax=Terribacillus halophilus TaxID=361279 RepID=UPI0021177D2C|nr:WecB/TagA/CpsF family glycosyltransferase [Terribacillus halophilus]
MENEKVEIMQIPFDKLTQKELLQKHLYKRIEKEQRTFIVTANPEIVMQTRIDHIYKESVQSADYIIPDGAGIVVASKILGNPIEERVTGFDLMFRLLSYADKHNLSCYFLGATEEVNESAVNHVISQYPGIVIAGRHNGYFTNDDEVAKHVAATKPDFVFAALGFPKQEKWIAAHQHIFEKGVFMGVGGVFDILAGQVSRAPRIWIKLNLEWAYRLIKQPFRWKRILKAFEFMFRIVLGRNKNKAGS